MADEPLGRMVIELGLDHSDFGTGLTGAKKEVKYAMAEMKSSMAVIGQSGKQFDILAAKSKGLSQVLMSQERVVEDLGKSYKNSLVDGKASASTAKYATELQNANAKLASLRTQYINNAGALAKARVETTGFTGGLNKVSKAAISTGTAVGNIGSKVSKVSVPVAAGLAYATKSAVSFDSQIKAMGPLLTNGGAITAKYKTQLDNLGNASKEMSTKYGVSTTEINNGMSELIRRGYTTNQVLGSMPSILDATMASGEDMGTVMQATASIVEQFGLKTNSTAGTMKNTQRVTDSLTYAANATAAGFGDMSEAMSYVGPVASSLGLSVEQTAAAVGELSNQGIEGQKAGTNLRGMLTSLVKPTKQNTEGFKSMGISSKQLAHDSHDLPQLIDDITKGTKGWSNAERGKALAQAFGRENQAAANALVKAGSKSLRDLTKDTENAGGATKKVADQMRNTSANNVKRLISSLQVLGIEIGDKLVPKFIPLVKKATDLVEGFSKMDDSTQNTIIKFGLLAAAGGPVLSMVSKLIGGFGKTGSAIVDMAGKFASWRAKSQATKEMMGDVTNAAVETGESMTRVGRNATAAKGGLSIFGTAMTTAEAGAGVLGTSLTVAGAAVTGVGLAAVAGVAYWELYGKSAYQSAQRVDEWGTDIGKTASDAAEKMTSFETKASSALDGFNTDATKNAKEVSKAFQDMVETTSKSVDKQHENAEKLAKQIGGDAGAALLKQADKEHSANEDRVKDMSATAKQVEQITSKSAKSGVKLTADQATTIANLQRKMAKDEIETLKIKSSQKKSVLAAELGETGSMTKKQLTQTAKDIGEAGSKELDSYNSKNGKIEQALKDGLISKQEADKAEEKLSQTHNATIKQLGEDYIKTQVKAGESASQAYEELQNKYGFSEKQAQAAYDSFENTAKNTASVAIKLTGDMSKATEKAANSWNSMVLDPKTGKLKTNAQEAVDKAAKNKDKWNSMLLLAKHGEMSSNAAAMVGVAAVQTKRWDGLTLKEKQAMIKSKGGDDLAALLQKGKQWGKFTPTEKKAIITAKGKPELLGIMTQAKTWNKLTVPEKRAVLKDNASPVMKKAKVGLDDWNKLTPQMKTVMAKAKGAEDVAKGVKNVKDWNSLPTSEKKLIANDKGARGIIKNVTKDYQKYENMPKNSVKNLLAKDGASSKATIAKISIDKFGRMKVTPVNLNAKNNTGGPVGSAKKNIASVPKTNGHKDLTASNKTSKGVSDAKGMVGIFVHMNGNKPLSTSNKTQPGVTSSKGTVTGFMQMPADKKITANNQTGTGVNSAKTSIDSVHDKKITITAMFNAVKAGATALWHAAGFKNGTTNFNGGTALVNDEEGPVFREAIKIPGRRPFIPAGRNVFIDDLPRGSQIIPARLTAQLYNIPQFANGTIPANASFIEASQVINESVTRNVPVDVKQVPQAGNSSVNRAFNSLNDDQTSLNPLLTKLLAINNAILQAIKDQGTFDTKSLYKRQAKDLSISEYGGLN